jgi:hypothetical protein
MERVRSALRNAQAVLATVVVGVVARSGRAVTAADHRRPTSSSPTTPAASPPPGNGFVHQGMPPPDDRPFRRATQIALCATLFTGASPTWSFRFVAMGKVPGDQPRKMTAACSFRLLLNAKCWRDFRAAIKMPFPIWRA